MSALASSMTVALKSDGSLLLDPSKSEQEVRVLTPLVLTRHIVLRMGLPQSLQFMTAVVRVY